MPLILLLALAVFVISLWQNLSGLRTSQFHPDESRWINRASYLGELFDPTGPTWNDRYLTRGQPPFGSYLTGLGLLLQDRDLGTNGTWNFLYGNEFDISWNVVKGNMPVWDDLAAARRTNAVVGALTCVALFLIVTRLTNPVGGLVGALFMAAHPLQIYLSSLAVSDALLTLLLALATLAVMALARRPSWPRTLLLGLLLGLGASTKLTPLFVTIPLAALGAVLFADPWLRRLRIVGRPWAWLTRADARQCRRLGSMLLALPTVSCAIFVASYPYLWPDPIGRTKNLIEFRTQEMDNQAQIWAERAVDSRLEALGHIRTTLDDLYSTSGRLLAKAGNLLGRDWDHHGFDVPVALACLALFAVLALRGGMTSQRFLAFFLLAAQTAVIVVGLRVDFNRYYLPIVLLFGVGIGVAVGQGWAWLLPRVSSRSWPVDSPRPDATPPQRLPPTLGTPTRPSGIADS